MQLRNGTNRCIFVLCLLVSLSLGLMSMFYRYLKFIPLIVSDDNIYNSFLVDTLYCKIPLLDPHHSSVYWYIGSKKKLTCSVDEDVLFVENSTIYINKHKVKRDLMALEYCKYDVIWRPNDIETHHNFYKYINESKPFRESIKVMEEFIRVRCFNNDEKVVHTNVFSLIHKKPEVEKKCKERFKMFNSENDHLSVLMVGIESVSRNNMLRFMPETRKYLFNEMSAIELLGYNKVDDNTLVNIAPMTTGKYLTELLGSRKLNESFDPYDFIWKEFSKNGYRTLYSEDAPEIQIFDYKKTGFLKPTADYFDRSFSVAIEEIKDIWNTGHNCIHGRPEPSVVLNYARQLAETFKDLPFFSFTFLSRLTHDIIDETSKADTLYLDFLKQVHKNLNNTLLIFFSDHGIRYGRIRQTFIGKMEERLPFMFYIFPPWFKAKYPNLIDNLQINTKRLTTPFDVYETLKHILYLQNYTVKQSRGRSLLEEIPNNRTCDDASITSHWCTCLQQTKLPISDDTVVYLAKTFVQNLNEQVKGYKCQQLHLRKIISAFITLSPKYETTHYERSIKIYQITLQTYPGDAVFEGTIQYNSFKKAVEMMKDYSRINKYGNTSHCVNDSQLKKICYCEVQLKSSVY